MKIKKITAITLILSIAFSGLAVAQAISSDSAVKTKGGGELTFCQKYPKFCEVFINGGGNGGGNEPF